MDTHRPGHGDAVRAGAPALASSTRSIISVCGNWRLPFLGEAARLQFRTEFFNVLNTPQFRQPNGVGWASPTSVIPDMGEIRGLRLPMGSSDVG